MGLISSCRNLDLEYTKRLALRLKEKKIINRIYTWNLNRDQRGSFDANAAITGFANDSCAANAFSQFADNRITIRRIRLECFRGAP
jgi:hypothetical protein